MSKPMPTVTIRLPVALMERIDAELAGPAYKFQIARPSRSDWIRNAIELRIAELDKRQLKKKKGPRRCAFCNVKVNGTNIGTTLPACEGKSEVCCNKCSKERLIS